MEKVSWAGGVGPRLTWPLALIALAPCIMPLPLTPHRAEGVECAGAVRPERTVAIAESASALPALVLGASGGASSGAAYG